VNSSLKEFQNIASKLIFPEPNLRWFFKSGWRLVGAEEVVGLSAHGIFFAFFPIRLTHQIIFIEIKCSALILKYLSQYLNVFGCPRLPLNFQNLIFGL